MANNSYRRSADRERAIKKTLEAEGWYAVRAAGSHGNADVVAIRPHPECGIPWHFEVNFIQIKTSKDTKRDYTEYKTEQSPCGAINVQYLHYAVRGGKKK